MKQLSEVKQLMQRARGEAQEDQRDMRFVKSSFCGGGDCVEVAWLKDGSVAVKDGKNATQKLLVFTPEEWQTFVKGVKAGEFDHLKADTGKSGRFY